MDRVITPYLRWPGVEKGKEDPKSWDAAPDAKYDIEKWESDNNIQLPDDYRRFMIKFNGGRVYPCTFKYAVPVERYIFSKPETFCDPIFRWSSVEKNWNGEVYGEGCPPGMLTVARDPGGIIVLLSVRKEDYGKIYVWPHSSYKWGDEDNRDMWLQANSFSEFLDSLYDDEEKNGYDYWYRPGLKHLVRKLEF